MAIRAEIGPVLVCVPTYNEVENIELIVAAIHQAQPDVHILVTDDASPDGTGRIADRLAATDHRVHVLHRATKSGLGPAYLAAFAWGTNRGYQVLVEMDADGSHRPDDLGALLEQLRNGADVALGSRWVPGGHVIDWPKHREWISRAGNRYAQLMLRLPLHDATGGYRAYRTEVITALDIDQVASQGYCFQIDLARRAIRQGFSVVEVPITFRDRLHGTSKMSTRIVAEALWRVTIWGLTSRLTPPRRNTPTRPAP